MEGLYDEDGIDGPFERGMKRKIRLKPFRRDLIAAAPELYFALKQASEAAFEFHAHFPCPYCPDNDHDPCPMLGRVKAALAKAEGR